MPVQLRLTAGLAGVLSTVNDLGTAKQDVAKQYIADFVPGIIANQADLAWFDQRTLALSASENIDLNGALFDAFGAAVNFAKVKALVVAAAAANANDVIIGNAASNGFVGPFGAATHTLAIKPGGFVMMAAPGLAGLGSIMAGTGDLLKVLNGGAGTPVTYDILVLGTSA